MNQSKIFLLIVILTAIIATAFVINYTRQSLPAFQPIKLPVKGKLPASEESKEQEGVTMIEIEKIKDEIKTEAEKEIIKYQETSFYSEDDFSVILENEESFKSQLTERLEESLIGVEASNFKIDLAQSKRSAILKCDIKGARYSTNSYDMHFLLGNWPFDLYQFKKYEKKLVYEGKIDGIPTKIVFEFPYELSHCHEHVWPK